MGAFAQLRLLLWKNFLSQIRSPIFTAFEFFVPLILIGASFGLLLGFRYKFETSYDEQIYPAWPVTGGFKDLVQIVTTKVNGTDGTILPLEDFSPGGGPNKCPFLKVIQTSSTSCHLYMSLAYAPVTPSTTTIMKYVQAAYSGNHTIPTPLGNMTINMTISMTVEVNGNNSEADLVTFLNNQLSDQCNNSYLGGIVFDDDFAHNPFNQSISLIKYKIRLTNTERRGDDSDGNDAWDTTRLFGVQIISGPRNKNDANGGKPGYWTEGFLTLQRAVDNGIISLLANLTNSPNSSTPVQLQRFPYPAYTRKMIEIGVLFLPIIIIYSYMTSVIYITRSIVQEKENRLKEYMKVMGLSQWLHWTAYFITNYIKLMFTVIILTALITPLLNQSDFSVVLVFFMLYAVNVVYFSFTVSTFLQSGTAGTLLAVFGWMVLYFWYVLFVNLDAQSPYPFNTRLLNCLNPNLAMGLGVSLMSQYEVQSNGFHWSNLFTKASPDEEMTMGHIFAMLIIDVLLMAYITWFVEAVNPGGEGVPQKPWFMFLPSYWFPNLGKKQMDNSRILGRMTSESMGDAKVEPEPSNLQPEISVAGLGKVYGTGFMKKLFDCKWGKSGEKKAVDGLNLKMYPGQVTALLGHNGAGKSTTFSMLTGVTPPSSGTAFISGYDIRTSLPTIRKYLGLCPQYNILFNNLTVMEHLEFFCKLKDRKYTKAEALSILSRLKIEFKQDSKAGTLSGGQKRKLSLAIALIGGSEIVMLDEPTSGMDPGARHETWTLLQSEKASRTILLTTHYMEEADLLGDRIAILAHGKLQCCGSSMFLKNQYGAGYHVTVVFNRESSGHTLTVASSHNPFAGRAEATMQLFRRHCPEVEMQSAIGMEASFLLPANYRDRFSALFRDLEQNQSALGITSFGVSITTMEEVFLKVGELADAKSAMGEGMSVGLPSSKSIGSVSTTSSQQMEKLKPYIEEIKVRRRLTGFARWFQQLRAMFIKRAIYFVRRWTQMIPQLVIPVAYMILFVWAAKAIPSVKEQGPLPINMSSYDVDGVAANSLIYSNSTNPLATNDISRYESALYAQNPDVNVHVTTITSGQNLSSKVVELFKELGSHRFGIHYPVGVKFEENSQNMSYTALFNNYPLHTPPLTLSLLDSAILQTATRRNISIQVTNHPLPPTTADQLKNTNNNSGAANTIGFAIIVAMSMVVSGYANFLIRERKKKVKHMQMMSGLHPLTFWLSSFVWDAVSFLLPSACFIGIMALFNVKQYVDNSETIFSLVGVMLLFGWAQIPFVYAFSFAFKSAPKGYTLIVLYCIISGMIGAIAVPIITALNSDDEDIGRNWGYFFSLFFPTYSISSCFSKIYMNEFGRQACEKFSCDVTYIAKCCDSSEKAFVDGIFGDFSSKGIGLNIAFFTVEGFLFWALVLLIEFDIFRKLRTATQPKSKRMLAVQNNGFVGAQTSVEDSDVIAEKEAVKQMGPVEASLIVKNLTKWYGAFNAVKGVNFAVKTGECFGLLGVNGAGKTSTFQMLTGENLVTDGDALVEGNSVKNSWRTAGQHIGYCPQFDAVIKEMSGTETLNMYARIRGIPEEDIKKVVSAVVNAIGIQQYAERQIKTYSGGNKRRLSLGMALVGLPEVLLLDEPTTGVDPKARRTIWNILSAVRAEGTALVLTSHSMEECEALCTELAIMVSGQFRCLGAAQHIKSRYGVGFTLLLRLADAATVPATKSSIERAFPGAVLKEEHVTQLSYELPREKDVSWSQLFDTLERLSQQLNIADYSLSQTTLEQIFLQFSKESVVGRSGSVLVANGNPKPSDNPSGGPYDTYV